MAIYKIVGHFVPKKSLPKSARLGLFVPRQQEKAAYFSTLLGQLVLTFETFCPSENERKRKMESIEIYADLMKSTAFNVLPVSAKWCYLCMAIESKGNRCFKFPRKTAEEYGIMRRTLIRNVQELIKAGFLNCRSGRTTRTANEYVFSSDWKKNVVEHKTSDLGQRS